MTEPVEAQNAKMERSHLKAQIVTLDMVSLHPREDGRLPHGVYAVL